MQHCLFNRYQDCSNYMHLPSVLASPQRVITFQIMCVFNILDNFLSDTAQTTTRYLKFDFVWSTATRFAQMMNLRSVLALPQRVIRFHIIMPKVNILNNFFLIWHKVDMIYLTFDIVWLTATKIHVSVTLLIVIFNNRINVKYFPQASCEQRATWLKWVKLVSQSIVI